MPDQLRGITGEISAFYVTFEKLTRVVCMPICSIFDLKTRKEFISLFRQN